MKPIEESLVCKMLTIFQARAETFTGMDQLFSSCSINSFFRHEALHRDSECQVTPHLSSKISQHLELMSKRIS